MRASLIAISALLALTSVMETAAAQPPAATAEFRLFSIGNLKAIALKDGSLQEPNDGKSFVMGHAPSEVAAVLKSGGAPTDHLEFSIQPLLVRAGDHVLLFDTGAGGNFGPIAGALPQSMQAAGVDPASVTDIFISHVHGDHIGGLLTPAGALAFPNATIHMSAPEWSYLSGMSADTARMVGLARLDVLLKTIKPKVAPFKPDADVIPGLVKAVEIRGHTPGHSGYLIGSGGNTLLYLGDTLHSSIVSVREPQWQIAFDADPSTGAASRVAFLARVAASGQRLYGVHLPFPGVGKIVKQDGGYSWVPESLH
jgi:glyoxylase-like metal-dependent hydrolase (beta-lactamase superfamily II)